MTEQKKPRRKDRVPMPEQEPLVRAKNFLEVPLGYDAEMAVEEAERCLQCKVPACACGCPVNIHIPGFIKLITERKFAEAARKIKETNALPAVCGRVCPQESQCEAQCVLNKMGRAVAIGRLARFAADYEREHELVQIPQKTPANGKKVAVVGSGPSGLTVAGDLVLKGYDVTIFEAFHKPGGVLMYGIPEFRLPKDIVEKEVDYLVRLGVNLKLNEIVGKTVTVEELFTERGFNAVFIGVGAGLPKFLGIPGENFGGMYSANEYLTRSNLMKAYRFPEYDTPIVKGKKVCVIGGGNVAMDSARTALRLGGDVSIVYRRSRDEMPARSEEIHHAEEEGVKLCLLTNPVEILGNEKGMVSGLKCSRMELGEPDESGRRKPVAIPNSEYVIESDLVINAIGAGANPLLTTSTPGLELNKWGYIVADEWGKTTREGVWAGGDIVTGMATVIEAMGAGRKAAMDIHEKVMGVPKAVPTPEALPDDMTCSTPFLPVSEPLFSPSCATTRKSNFLAGGKIALICNGAINDYRWLARECERHGVLIAVDGGADHLRRAGLRPDLVVGDMDSIVEPFGPDVPVSLYPERKDESDMELAVRHVLALEHSSIDVYGALEGRQDHQFCNIMVLTNYQAAVTIRAENASIRCVHENTAAELHRKGEADIVTIMPVDETAVVTTKGLEYGLDGEALARGSRGLSNVMKEESAVVRVASGKVLLFHSW